MPFTFTSMSATWVCRESSANTEVRASTYQEPRLVFRMAAVPGERMPTMNTFGEHRHKKPPYAQTITFQTSISTDHIRARGQPQLQAFFLVCVAFLTAWRIWPSFAISLIHSPVQLICGGNKRGEREREKKLSWITGCSFPVLTFVVSNATIPVK